MTARLATLVVHDARLQFRYGVYAAYAVVVLFYGAVLYLGGAILPRWLLALTIATDPSVVGFFFLGGLMLLEKAEAARMALAMAPVSAGEYLAAKTTTLTAVALVAVVMLGLVIPGGVDWPVYLAATVTVSVQFVGIGALFALRFKTVTGYLIGSAGLMLPVVLPGFVAFLDPMPVALTVLPFAATLRLFMVALGAAAAELWEIGVMLAVAVAYAAAGVWIGIRALQKELGVK